MPGPPKPQCWSLHNAGILGILEGMRGLVNEVIISRVISPLTRVTVPITLLTT